MRSVCLYRIVRAHFLLNFEGSKDQVMETVLHAFCHALRIFEGTQYSTADLRQRVMSVLWQQKSLLEQRLSILFGEQPNHLQQNEVLETCPWELDFPVAKGLIDFCAWTHNIPVDKGPTEGTHHLQDLPWDLADYFAHVARQGAWLGPLEVQALAWHHWI